jgi:hypothetical protein
MSGPFQRIVRRGGEQPDEHPPQEEQAPAGAGEPEAPTQQTAALDPVDQPTEATAPLDPAALGEQPTTAGPAAGEPPAEQPTSFQPAADQPTTVQPPAGEPPTAPPGPIRSLGGAPVPTQPAPVSAPAQAGAPPGWAPAPAPGGAPVPIAVPSEAPPEPRRPGFRERGRLRRRLRYLRKLRELQVRDLGGLVFDLRRFERKRDDLVAQKIDQIRACDDELRALETALDDRRDLREVREPGIGGTCPRCFAIFGSTDRFCGSCCAALGGAVQGPAQVTAPAPPAPQPQPPGTGVPPR